MLHVGAYVSDTWFPTPLVLNILDLMILHCVWQKHNYTTMDNIGKIVILCFSYEANRANFLVYR